MTLFSKFIRDRKASVAIYFALTGIPAFMLIGFAMDYGIALSNKAKLDTAVDAASMAAITTAKSVIQSSSSSGSSVTSAAIAQGQAAATAAFAANTGAIAYASVPTPTVSLARDAQNPQKLTATVSYSVPTRTNFVGFMGIKQINLNGTSTSTLTMPTYINYYFVTDISQSMGVGATPTDMQNLYNRVITYNNYDTQADKTAKIGCVFGCHVQQVSGSYTQPVSNETLAHSALYGATITLRIDSAKSAIQTILSDAQAANTASGMNLVQVAVYTMQQDPQNSGSYIQTISAPPSSSFSTIGTKVTAMDLGNNNGGGSGDTGFANSLNYFASNILSTQGDGSTQAKALNYVFLITDGLADVPGSCTDGHCTGAFNDSLCTQLKAKGTVGVIYTTYNPIYVGNVASNGFVDTYRDLVASNVGSIPGNLLACSSGSQWYFEASDGPAITTGMQKLFAPTLQAARISQ